MLTLSQKIEANAAARLTLPAGDVFIRARGRVIRVERENGTNGPSVGVAATMESYDIVRADAAAV